MRAVAQQPLPHLHVRGCCCCMSTKDFVRSVSGTHVPREMISFLMSGDVDTLIRRAHPVGPRPTHAEAGSLSRMLFCDACQLETGSGCT